MKGRYWQLTQIHNITYACITQEYIWGHMSNKFVKIMVMDKVLENTFYKDCSLPYFLDKNTRSEILPVAVHVSFILN